MDGLCVSGFSFEAANPPPADPPDAALLSVYQASGEVVIEDCRTAAPPESAAGRFTGLQIANESGGAASIVVRECWFKSALSLVASQVPVRYFVLRNLFDHPWKFHQLTIGGRFDTAVVRHNLFVECGTSLFVGPVPEGARLEISNNTHESAGAAFAMFAESPTNRRVVIRNNWLSHKPVQVIGQGPQPTPAGSLVVDHNGYSADWFKSENGMPLGPYDVRTAPAFLATQISNRDFLRIPASSTLATAGAGGDWPAYIGALPPGPAPGLGDWLTRLLQRWQQAPASR